MNNNSFDIAFFSFNRHQDLLVPGLKSVIRNVPNFNEIILVWDDYLRERPIDFDQIKNEVGYDLRIIKHTELYDWPESIGKWGWVKQQLAKLLCFTYSNSKYTWICDGDVLLTGDPELFHNGKPYLRYDSTEKIDETDSGYYHFIKKYFNIQNYYPYSWIGSTNLFDNSICKEMFDFCLTHHNKSLIECVKETIENSTSQFPFSEFETYGNYCYTNHQDKFYIDTYNWSRSGHKIKNRNFPIQVDWHLDPHFSQLMV